MADPDFDDILEDDSDILDELEDDSAELEASGAVAPAVPRSLSR